MRKRKHAGAAARRESERQAALNAVADPKAATGAELVWAVTVEREVFAEEVARAKALPVAEARAAMPELEVRRDRIKMLDAELATRPTLIKSDGMTSNVHARRPESEQTRLRRVLDDLAVKAGVARRTPSGVTTLSEEEQMQAHLARLRRARGPEPKAVNVAAAIGAWLTGKDGWPWVSGSADEIATLEDRDVAALFIALGLIAQSGESGSVAVRERAPLSGTRVRCESFAASLKHLERNGLLRLKRQTPELLISYGPLTLDIARKAGVAVGGDEG